MCVVADPKDPSPPSDPAAMDGPPEALLLLEHAASDDLPSLTRAAAGADLPHDAPNRWYGRWWAHGGLRPVRYERRTTLMVAALYGSASVVEHLLSSDPSSANRRCGSDSATPLHCAAAGGAPSAPRVVRLLLSAGADPSVPDASGRTPADLLPRHSRSRPALEALLRGGDPEEEGEEERKPVSVVSAGEKKKEYPVDATLPDIKSGIYGTDEFRMYTFKVKPCSRAYSHDWTECPFVHPGENARRRDPRKYHYSCVPCPDFRKGSCRNGDACEYAHGVFESWLHPAQYRTRLCKDETGCTRRVCFFAHKPEELRPLYPSSSPSPRGGSSAAAANLLPPLDLGAAAAMLLNQQQQQPTSTALAAWLNGAPTSPLPSSSRLKAGVTARDIDVELDLMGFDGYATQQHLQQKKQQQNLMDEIGSISPPSSWSNPLQLPMGSPIARGSGVGGDYGDIFGSLDSSSPCPPSSSLLYPRKGLSLKRSGSSFQSPTQLQKHQQQLLYGGGGNLPSSPSARSSSPSLAATLMSSRASAFTKQRSQSFVDRGATRLSSLPVTTNTPVVAPVIFDWGSPDGKVDWAIQGDELSKLRKSASFAFRDGGVANAPAFAAEEPDVSWVHSLVKDGPPMTTTAAGAAEPRRQQYPPLNGGATAGGGGGERFSSGWADQLCLEQEQMVA